MLFPSPVYDVNICMHENIVHPEKEREQLPADMQDTRGHNICVWLRDEEIADISHNREELFWSPTFMTQHQQK